MNRHLSRELEIDAAGADKKRRSFPVVISTTFPVERDGYREVLLHDPENVDLSRAPLPLIESHNGRALNIGIVQDLKLSGGKLRGVAIFGNSSRANELWPDIEAGIVRSLSVGYVINDHRARGDTIEVTRWQPYETSLVSIPADPTAGTYRSKTMNNENEGPSAADAGERLSRGQRRAVGADRSVAQRAIDGERERCTEIRALSRFSHAREALADKADEFAEDAITDGLTVDEFRTALLAAIESATKSSNAARRFTAVGPAARRGGEREFNLVRAIAGAIDPKIDNGYERECSQEMARQLGRQPNGIFMPIGSLSERVFSAASAPAMVGTQHMGGEFIDALRARSFVMQLGTRVLSGLTQDVSIPRLNSSATSGWIGGDGIDGLTPSDQGIDSVTLTPKTVGALTVLSRKMILQGDPQAEQLVRDDFAKLIAMELDRAAINGSGAANQPRGVIGSVGVTTGTYPLAGPNFASVLAMEAALMADNADGGALAYLTTPALAAALKGSETATGSGQFVWTAGRERGAGQANGLPAYASSNVPVDNIVLGNWEDLLMGLWGAIDIDVDPHYDFAKGSTAVRILTSVDFAVRHPESFAVWSRAAT